MGIEKYLGRDIPCTCGRVHRTDLKRVEISSGAIRRLPDIIRECGYHKVFLIADENTSKALGRQAEAVLTAGGVPFAGVILPEDVQADELGVGRVLMHFDRNCDLILAIGAGTINDIGKFVSFTMHLPYFIAATAPSMDGFASNVAAMTTDRMKTTYPAHVPECILADLDVLCKAPMPMIAAGLGDILGKYTALCDWKLSAIINGEYHCPAIAEMMETAIAQAAGSVDGLLSRDTEAVKRLTEALILSGIAMSFAIVSRPASGSEHHISHFWEMRFISEGRKPVLHGTKVGVGTILSLRLYQKLLSEPVDFQAAYQYGADFRYDEWERAVTLGFGPAAEGVLKLEKTARKNASEPHNTRVKVIIEHWDELTDRMKELPSPETVKDILFRLSAPTTPNELGIDEKLTAQAVLLAKEVRDRYTILQLLWDLGLLSRYAVEAAQAVAGENPLRDSD